MRRVLLGGLAVLLSAPAALGYPQSAGYSCSGVQTGDFGRISARVDVDDAGRFHINKWAPASSGSWTLKLNVIDSPRQDQPEINVQFERDDADFSKPLRFAWLSAHYYVYPLPQKPTFMFLTLDTGERIRQPFITASMIREWQHSNGGGFGGAFQTRDPAFFAALLKASTFAIDIIDEDGAQISRSVYAAAGFAAVRPALDKLDSDAIAAMKNYRTACHHLEIELEPF